MSGAARSPGQCVLGLRAHIDSGRHAVRREYRHGVKGCDDKRLKPIEKPLPCRPQVIMLLVDQNFRREPRRPFELDVEGFAMPSGHPIASVTPASAHGDQCLVVRLTVPQVRAQIDELARAELGVSGAEALERLDNGDFDGTILETELSSLRDLLGDSAPFPVAAE
jgi:hypothetical protein